MTNLQECFIRFKIIAILSFFHAIQYTSLIIYAIQCTRLIILEKGVEFEHSASDEGVCVEDVVNALATSWRPRGGLEASEGGILKINFENGQGLQWGGKRRKL